MKNTIVEVEGKKLSLDLPDLSDLAGGPLARFPSFISAVQSLEKVIALHEQSYPFDQVLYHIHMAFSGIKYEMNKEILSFINDLEQLPNLSESEKIDLKEMKDTYNQFLNNIQESQDAILVFQPSLKKRIDSLEEKKNVLLPLIAHREEIATLLCHATSQPEKMASYQAKVSHLLAGEDNLGRGIQSDSSNNNVVVEVLSMGISKVFKVTSTDIELGETSIIINLKPRELFTEDSLAFRNNAYEEGIEDTILNAYDMHPLSIPSHIEGISPSQWIIQVSDCCPNGSLDRVHDIKNNVTNGDDYTKLMGIKFIKHLLMDKTSDAEIIADPFAGDRRVRVVNAHLIEEARSSIRKIEKHQQKNEHLPHRIAHNFKKHVLHIELPKMAPIKTYIETTLKYALQEISNQFELHELDDLLEHLDDSTLNAFIEKVNELEETLQAECDFSMSDDEERLLARLAEDCVQLFIRLEEKKYHYWDLKAGNIMLDDDWNPVITDDKTFSKENEEGMHFAHEHTAEKAPEHDRSMAFVFSKERASQLTSFQLGRVLYRLVSGSDLLTSETFRLIAQDQNKTSPLLDLDVFNKTAFGKVAKEVISQLCHPDPDKRMTPQQAYNILNEYNCSIGNNKGIRNEGKMELGDEFEQNIQQREDAFGMRT